MDIQTLDPADFQKIVIFTGAGMSAESGVPTYRGKGGIWNKYNWEEVACQEAFEKDAMKVLDFHEKRRKALISCKPHKGHKCLVELEKSHPVVTIVTQNIDGMHQKAGSRNVIELHGSLWRLRCPIDEKTFEDAQSTYRTRYCHCGAELRPDIIWFGDVLDQNVVFQAENTILACDLFVSVGTSAVVWPAAGFLQTAKKGGAYCVEINPEPAAIPGVFDVVYPGSASVVLPALFTGNKS